MNMQEYVNTYKETEQPQPEPAPRKKAGRSVPKAVRSVLGGYILTREKVTRLLPFLIYITLIGLLYIFNANVSVKTIIEINQIKKQNEELRFDFVTTKAKLMQSTRQSALSHRLEARGIYEAKIPPRKIIVEADQN
jgi:hypothetical protein